MSWLERRGDKELIRVLRRCYRFADEMLKENGEEMKC